MGKVVCVTGASGYVASWVVKLLLHRGYTVHAAVRNLNNPSKTAHLKSLQGAEERLRLFEAELMEEGSFDAAFAGCDGVFHTASPVILENVNDPQVELMEPAVNGTLNVLRSCVKVASIKRVILTSSMATVMASRNPLTSDTVVDETWFSDAEFCRENEQWYVLSKVLAEEAARKYAKENRMDLIVINPSLVIGPLLQPTLNVTSHEFISLMRHGSCNAMPGGVFVYVDVRDVADAHVLAFENPSAGGRYCVVGQTLFASEALNILRKHYPTLVLAKRSEEDEAGIKPFTVCNAKAKSLGMDFVSVEQSLKDTVDNLIERKLITLSM